MLQPDTIVKFEHFALIIKSYSVAPLTGTKSESHLREDLSIFDLEFTAADIESLDGLLSGESMPE